MFVCDVHMMYIYGMVVLYTHSPPPPPQIIPSMSLFRALYEITQRAALTTLQGTQKHQFAQRWENLVWAELGAPVVSMVVQSVVLLTVGLTIDQVCSTRGW